MNYTSTMSEFIQEIFPWNTARPHYTILYLYLRLGLMPVKTKPGS